MTKIEGVHTDNLSPFNFNALVTPGQPRQSGGLGRQIAAALQHANEEQREQAESLVAYLQTGKMAVSNLSTTSDGGVLVPSFVQSVIERNFCPVLAGQERGPRHQHRHRRTADRPGAMSDSESAVQVAEADLTGLDATVSGDTPPTSLTGPKLGAYKLSSKPVNIPRETLTDGSGDILGDVLAALIARVIRYENYLFTNGSGSGQAEGFLKNCSYMDVSAPLDLDMCLDLAYTVPALNRPNGVYLMSDATGSISWQTENWHSPVTKECSGQMRISRPGQPRHSPRISSFREQ